MRPYLFTILFLISKAICSQNAFYDAQKLDSLFKSQSPKIDLVFSILSEYSGLPGDDEGKLKIAYADTTNCNDSYFSNKVNSFIDANNSARFIEILRYCQNSDSISNLGSKYPASPEIRNRLDSIGKYVSRINNFNRELLIGSPDLPVLKEISNTGKPSPMMDSAFIQNHHLDTTRNNLKTSAANEYNRLLRSNPIQIKILSEKTKKENNLNILSGLLLHIPPQILTQANTSNNQLSISDNPKQSQINLQLESEKLSSYSVPSQSEAIDALSIFIAGRFKEEVSLTFFNTLREKLDRDSLLSTLFPQTFGLLNFTDVFDQPTLGGTWQHAFSSDLIEMPDHLAETTNPRFQSGHFKDFCTIYSIVNQLRERKNYVDIIDLLVEQKKAEAAAIPGRTFFSTRIEQLLGLMQMVNETFVDKDSKRFWISYTELKNMSNDEFAIFFGLIKHKYSDLFTSLKFNSHYNFDTNYNQLKLSFLNILLSLNELEKAYAMLSNGKEDNSGTTVAGKYSIWKAHYDVFSAFMGFSKAGTKMIGTTLITTADSVFDSPTAKRFDFIFSNLTETSQAIDNQQYNVLINNMVELIQLLYKGPIINYATIQNKCRLSRVESRLDRVRFYINGNRKRSTFNSLRTDIIQQIDEMKAEDEIKPTDIDQLKIKIKSAGVKHKHFIICRLNMLRNYTKRIEKARDAKIPGKYQTYSQNNFLKPFIGYMSFVSDALRSTDSKSLAKVVASYAAPPNSYKIKRNNIHSADICSYPGLFYGNEWELSSGTHSGQVVGFTTPVGLSFSWGMRRHIMYPSQIGPNTIVTRYGRYRNLTGASFSLVATGLDLGAVVSYRLTHADDQPLPKNVTLAQVFSPGLFLNYGFRNTPLCVMLGGEINPKLRTFSDGAIPSNTYKVSITFCYDIPLYNIWYTKKRYTTK